MGSVSMSQSQKPEKGFSSNDDEVARRKRLTFAQAEGAAPLPTQLKRTEISSELRAVLWNYIYRELEETADTATWTYVGEPWRTILRDVHVYLFHQPADEFDANFKQATGAVKRVFMAGDYVLIYGWLQHVLRLRALPDFEKRIDKILVYCRSPYRMVAPDVIAPVGSDLEAKTVAKALADLNSASLAGGREHLKAAASELSAGHFADSVRESISAVESVVRVLEPDGDFSKALAKLETKTNIHGALKKGFLSIYGFTSDEQGVRHALLDKDAPNVDEADALFMIGACSAFVSYLINKARAVGLLKD
jgi:hypothetical protein